jgi:hypothetical protein
LIVGATRILRPAVEDLRTKHAVFALARDVATIAGTDGVRPVAADLTDLEAMQAALRNTPRFSAALVYAPRAAPGVRELIAQHVDGRLVELLTSQWAAPEDTDRPDAIDPDTIDPDTIDPDAIDPAALDSVGVPLLLGWTADSGVPRWHTPSEISAAALEVLVHGRPAVLGTVRPWHTRPVG